MDSKYDTKRKTKYLQSYDVFTCNERSNIYIHTSIHTYTYTYTYRDTYAYIHMVNYN